MNESRVSYKKNKIFTNSEAAFSVLDQCSKTYAMAKIYANTLKKSFLDSLNYKGMKYLSAASTF